MLSFEKRNFLLIKKIEIGNKGRKKYPEPSQKDNFINILV